MRWKHRLAAMSALSALLIAVPSGEVRALGEGRGAGGEPYLTGGIGGHERDLLIKRRQDFNVWITTAAKQSGVYLGDVRVKVVDAASRVVLEAPLDGPLMFIRLKPGQYTIEATLEQQKQAKAVAVGAQGHRELYFYFEVQAEIAPREPEAKGDGPKPKR